MAESKMGRRATTTVRRCGRDSPLDYSFGGLVGGAGEESPPTASSHLCPKAESGKSRTSRPRRARAPPRRPARGRTPPRAPAEDAGAAPTPPPAASGTRLRPGPHKARGRRRLRPGRLPALRRPPRGGGRWRVGSDARSRTQKARVPGATALPKNNGVPNFRAGRRPRARRPSSPTRPGAAGPGRGPSPPARRGQPAAASTARRERAAPLGPAAGPAAARPPSAARLAQDARGPAARPTSRAGRPRSAPRGAGPRAARPLRARPAAGAPDAEGQGGAAGRPARRSPRSRSRAGGTRCGRASRSARWPGLPTRSAARPARPRRPPLGTSPRGAGGGPGSERPAAPRCPPARTPAGAGSALGAQLLGRGRPLPLLPPLGERMS